MGLDLIVEGCARPGHEAEWRAFLERAFSGEEVSDAMIARFHEIIIPPYERLDAPRVGYDVAADAWMFEANKASTPDEQAVILRDFHGYYVLRLVTCDGIPNYTHAGMYDGVDETSFRGSFLDACGDILSPELIADAWNSKLPEAAESYGRALLAAADAAQASPKPSRRSLLSRLGLGKGREQLALDEQLDIVRSAGRWFIFWAERGHAIRAWF